MNKKLAQNTQKMIEVSTKPNPVRLLYNYLMKILVTSLRITATNITNYFGKKSAGYIYIIYLT